MTVTWRSVGLLGRASVMSAALLVFGCGGEGTLGETSAEGGLTADHVIPTGQACVPTGKHLEHRGFACATCHMCAGTVSFDGAVAGATAAFDANTKTCSSVACHGVPAGTFTYYTYDWGSETTVAVTVPYGGPAGGSQSSPNWYATAGLGCNACHGYPPTYNGVPYVWHSGMHGYGISNGNTCQLCHPDATGAYVSGGPPSYASTSGGMIASCAPGTTCSAPGSITNASLHRNGTLNVSPNFGSACIGCH
jgi:predicted CxxxxCH...CXXCH cytochrome family protein